MLHTRETLAIHRRPNRESPEIAAAILYSLSIPFAKLLIEDGLDSSILAGLLYLGAGLGMTALSCFEKLVNSDPQRNLCRKDRPYLLAMVLLEMALLDIAAPLLLMHGLSLSDAGTASLLGNFEIVATALIAAVVFKERVGKKLWLAIDFLTASWAILPLSDASSIANGPSSASGSAFILAATCCWRLENNYTNRLSQRSPVQVVAVKGIGSGAYCSVAPFAGAALSWLLFGIRPGALFVPAILLMVLGSHLSLPEKPDQTKTVRPEGRTDNN